MKQRLIEAAICVVIIFGLCLLSPSGCRMLMDPLGHEPRALSRRSRVVADLRVLATALEAYQQEHGRPPAMVPLRMYGKSFKVTGAWPTQGFFEMAPIDGAPPTRDPFSSAGYSYWTDGQFWVLHSPGPDNMFTLHPVTDLAGQAANRESILQLRTYDSTNGTFSGGDLMRHGTKPR